MLWNNQWSCWTKADTLALLMGFHFPMSITSSRWGTFPHLIWLIWLRLGKTLHCAHSQSLITRIPRWCPLYKHSRHFIGITWQWTLVSVWHLIVREIERERAGQRVSDMFAAFSRKECWNKHEDWADQQDRLHQHITVEDATTHLSSTKWWKCLWNIHILAQGLVI